MKKLMTLLLAAGLSVPGTACSASEPEHKALIVFYSRTNSTRTVAEQIRELTGGTLLELVPETPYPDDYEACVAQAKEELESGYRPALKNAPADLADYDVIFIGSPIWWGHIAPPASSFLAGNDLSGKTVVPFCTHLGSGQAQSVSDIRALCPQSAVSAGIAVRGDRVRNARQEIADWLRRINLQK